MKPTTELFDLIKSLNRSERRYFKLNASVQKGNKNYLKLFEAVVLQTAYDEQFLKRNYKNEKFITNLTVTKNYLYKLIVRSLNSYYNEKSVDTKLNNLLNKCRLLYNKALFSQYFKSVQSGKEMAVKFEMFSYQLEFLELERQLTRKEELGKKSMDDIYDEEINIIEKVRTINSYKRAVSKLFRIYWQHGTIRSKRSDEEVDLILSDELFRNEKQPSSLIAKERYYFALYLAHLLKGSFNTSFRYNKKRFSLISENKDVFQKFIFDNYEESFLSLISSAVFAGKFSEAEYLYGRFSKSFNRSGTVRLDHMSTYYSFKLQVMTYETREEDLNLVYEFEKFLTAYKGKLNIDTYNASYYNLSRYFFIKGDFQESLRIINILFQSRLLKHTPRIEPYTRLLNILVHFELGNVKLLLHLIPATEKYLKNKNKLFRTEKVILVNLKKIITHDDNGYAIKNFESLKKEMKALKKVKYEKNAFIYFDYIKWLNKKTEL